MQKFEAILVHYGIPELPGPVTTSICHLKKMINEINSRSNNNNTCYFVDNTFFSADIRFPMLTSEILKSQEEKLNDILE